MMIAMAAPAAAIPPVPTARFVLADFGFDQAWRVDKHVRVLADITGDGRADIVGFGDNGVHTAVADGTGGFHPGVFVLADLAFNQGWRVFTHQRFVTDITGDGRADIVAVGNAGVFTAVAQGNGAFGPLTFVGLNSFGALNRPSPSVVLTGDNNGDGRTDLYLFTNGRLDVARAAVSGTFAAPFTASFEFTTNRFDFNHFQVADVTGDRRSEVLSVQFSPGVRPVSALPRADGTYGLSQPSTNNGGNTSSFVLFTTADVTGDGRRDAVMFGPFTNDRRTFVGASLGNGTFAPFQPAINDFGPGAGYGIGGTPTPTLADITGEGRADLVGFNASGTSSAVSLGTTFAASRFVNADFGNNRGWRVDRHPRLLGDITGDGRADIVGFGNGGVFTAVATGDGSFTGGPAVSIVPSLQSLTITQARSALQEAGLVLGMVRGVVDHTCNDIGRVVSQLPFANSQVPVGSAVNVSVGQPPPHPCP